MNHNLTYLFAGLATAVVAGGLVLANRGTRQGPTGATPDSGTGPVIERVDVRRVAEAAIPDGKRYAFDVKITGQRFFGTAFGPFVRFNGVDAVAVILDSDRQITAYGAPSLAGDVIVEVENPDHARASVKSRFE